MRQGAEIEPVGAQRVDGDLLEVLDQLEEVADPGLLTAATPAELGAVTTDLASSDRPVAAATYRLEGSYAAETEWLTATVEVTGRDGETRAATLVFVPTPDGPRLVLLGAAGGPA